MNDVKDANLVQRGEKTGKEESADAEEVHSVSDNHEEHKHDVAVGVTSKSELDRAGLKSAFRFAAWSSVALVSKITEFSNTSSRFMSELWYEIVAIQGRCAIMPTVMS